MARKKQSKNQFFAERLKEMLKKEGIGHSELAMHLGVSREAVNYYTLGKNEPSLQSLVKIAQFLNVSTDYLLGNTTVVKVKRRPPV